MSWTPVGRAVDTSIDMTVGHDVEIKFLVNANYPDTITLVIGESNTEIAFHPETVERLRDKADVAVRQLRDAVAGR
jgi:hypothetical protein